MPSSSRGRFRFAPSILARLGEELVPHADLGIVELVRNSFDADATFSVIELTSVSMPGGSVQIVDDGRGMTREEILDDWLLLGSSNKREIKRSPSGRRMVGEKGLGRLAALRLGRRATLRSRPVGEPGVEYRLEISWDAFDDAAAVEDVVLEVVEGATEDGPGTTIELRNLRSPLRKADVKRLARSLVLLSDPFSDASEFTASLITDEFTEMEAVVRRSFFPEAHYKVEAILTDSGRAEARMTDWRGERIAAATHRKLAAERDGNLYDGVAAQFELWAFVLSKASFDARRSTQSVDAVKSWLRHVGGVHLYHRGLRVQPYGDPGQDWLDLNLRRTGSPEERPSTNTALGRVTVDDGQDQLVAKTDRSGLIENQAFEELRAFCSDVLEWAASERVRLRDERKAAQRRRVTRRVDNARGSLESAVAALPASRRQGVQDAVRKYERAVGAQLRDLDQDLQLYRTLSTVGTTTAVFAHESLRPVDTISVMASSIETEGRDALGNEYEVRLGDAVDVLKASANSLRSFADLPLSLLEHGKRRVSRVNVPRVALNVVEVFEPFLSEAEIRTEVDAPTAGFSVNASVASIEAIIANLVINAAYVLINESTAVPRRLRVSLTASAESGVLRIMDNGPGIHRLDTEEIWRPGRTTRPGGTGLGLTIVRDVVESLSGSAHAIQNGELGGAEFVVEMPLADPS